METARTARSARPVILVVDDEEPIRLVATDILRHLGYEVATAASGEDAVARIEGGARPDLILLDVIMPGIGGLEAFRRLRAIAPDIPVLISSGYADRSHREALLAQGVSGFVDKPYQMETLAARIRALVK